MSLPIAPIEERSLFAIGLVLVTVIFFTICDAAAKWLVMAGIPPMEVSFMRYAVHLAVIGGMVLPRHGLSAFRTANLRLQLIRAFAMLATTALNFAALMFLPLTMTGAIMFTMPLMICALSVPLLGEHVGWRRWAAILVGFAGVLIIVRPGAEDFHWAVILSFGMVISSAFFFILTRKLAGRESPMTMQLYVGLVGAVALAPFALADWVWPSDGSTWFAFFAVGLAAMTGHQISIAAHRFAPASTLAPFTYTQIIWMSLASWLVFDQPPDIWLFLGTPIVIGSGLYIWLRERQLAKPFVSPISPQDPAELLETTRETGQKS